MQTPNQRRVAIGFLVAAFCLTVSISVRGQTTRVMNINLDVKNVSVFEEAYVSKPGMFPVRWDQVDLAYYQNASDGRLTGTGGLLGCLPTLYPNDSRIEVGDYSRSGSAISITLRLHSTGGKSVPYSDRKTVLFGAHVPRDLPDGHYTASCIVLDDAASPATPPTAVLHCEFDLPDPADKRAEKDILWLDSLSDPSLLKEYERRGDLLKGTNIGPIDDGLVYQSSIEYMDDRNFAWGASQAAIVRRGASLVPALVEFLRREVPRNQVATDGIYGFGFARNLMEMLGQIGDPRPVPVLVDILSGFDGKANPKLRQVALESVQRLTLLTFFSDDASASFAVPADSQALYSGARGDDDETKLWPEVARRYRAWLAGQGKDPSAWLPLARQRARKILAGVDLPRIYLTVDFLETYLDIFRTKQSH